MNKVDKLKKIEKVEENLLTYKLLFEKNYPVVKISAKTGRNIDTLIKNIYKYLPDGDLLYPEDVVTEETMRDVTEEVIREKDVYKRQNLVRTTKSFPAEQDEKFWSYVKLRSNEYNLSLIHI